APAGPQLLTHQRVDDRVHALARNDAAPEEVADVRAERVDLPLLAVEREHVVAPAAFGPELLVESAPQFLGVALEPVGERAVAPDLAGHLGRAALGVVDVPLHLARRDRPACERAVV